MKISPYYLALLLYAFIALDMHAQLKDFKVTNYTSEDGLSQNTVYCSLQDQNGFMWFGTRSGGLDRFDGIEFKHHRRNPYNPHSIGGNEVNILFEDSEGLIWGGLKNKGLTQYNPYNQQFTNYYPNSKDTNGICAATVYGIEEDTSGDIWLATGWGLCVFSKETGLFTQLHRRIAHKKKVYYKGISSITRYGNKHMIISELGSGLTLINTETKKIEQQWKHDENNPKSIKSNQLIRVHVDNSNRIWVASNQFGLCILNNIKANDFIYITPKNNLASKVIRDIIQDSKGNIWIVTDRGINVINHNTKITEDIHIAKYAADKNNSYSLSQNSLYEITEDRQGNFWVGSWSGGVGHIDVNKSNFKHFQCIPDNNRTLNMPMVRSIFKQDNEIWVGTQGGGVNILNTETGLYEFTLKTNKLKHYLTWASSIQKDSDGTFLIGSIGNGLVIYDAKTDKATSIFVEEKIFDVLCTDSHIWVLTESNVQVLNKNEILKNPIDYTEDDFSSIKNTPYYVSFEDNKKRVWIGGPDGLLLFNNKSEVINQFKDDKSNSNSLSANLVTTISQDKKNNIWVGTVDGLNIYNEDSTNFISFGEWDGLLSNEIQNLFSDQKNNIWVTTPQGLSCFEYNLNVASTKDILFNFKHYTVDDGLQGNQFSNNCNFTDKDGTVYLGGHNGYNSFHPDSLRTNKLEPEIILTDFELFNKSVILGADDSPLKQSITNSSAITLNHTQNIFSFKFAALNFVAAEKNQFAYKMEGFDDDWNYIASRREANYTKLPTGNYTFRVKAANNDGIWNEEGTSIKVTILPPWYETWWFRSIIATAIIGSTIYLSRRRVKIIKERQRKLEQKVNEATAESESRSKKLAEAKERLSIIMDDVKLELGDTSAQLLEATNSQASTIEEISASIDQMASEINTSASDAAKMHVSAKEIEADSEISVRVVNNTVKSIEDIAHDIESISGFARTTNLLALNATIEAAKAGEYGRSFSVVANEIKKLADSSQEMAVNIKKTSNKGLESSREANSKINELQSYIHNIVLLIDQIKESSQNQSYEANNVNTAIQQISNYVSGTSGLAGKLDEAIKSLSIED